MWEPLIGSRASGATSGPSSPSISSSLYRFARTLVRDPHTVEDLVQETFLRAFQKRDTFRGDASVRTWVHRIPSQRGG